MLAVAVCTGALRPPSRWIDAELNRRAAVATLGAAAAATFAIAAPASAKDRVAGYPIQKDWRNELASGPYYILRQGGTEPPNSSPLVKEKRAGKFMCVACERALFASDQKFESGTGWPSFADKLEVEVVGDNPLQKALLGSELRCKGCGGHLGDVFADGFLFPGTPAAKTGLRHCIDGAALVFVPDSGEAPVSGDGLTNRTPPKEPDWLQPPKVGNAA